MNTYYTLLEWKSRWKSHMLIGSTDDYQMALELWTLNIFVCDKNDFKIELNSLFFEKNIRLNFCVR